jgi:ubiquinone biosynthesis accessory factor UbiK
MFNTDTLDDIAKQLSATVPESLRHLQGDIQQKFKAVLQDCFAQLDLVTREEFDTQVKVLARSRALLEALERRVNSLEEEAPK